MKILKIRNCDKKCADFRFFIINGIITHSQSDCIIYVVVNFLFQVIFIFLLFLGMVIYANEVETKEK